MLLMRGSQTEFVKMSDAEQTRIIAEHRQWSQELISRQVFVDGNGFSNITLKLVPEKGKIRRIMQPYIDSAEELSGYYIITAESLEVATEIAKTCPALAHNESVEIIPLGH
jgi:hypothetical protein